VGPEGEPVRRTILRGLRLSVSSAHLTRTNAPIDEDGGFSAAALPAGDYTILVDVPGDAEYVDTWWRSGATPEEADVLTLAEGDDLEGLEIRLQRK
jgi:hypothetical protein